MSSSEHAHRSARSRAVVQELFRDVPPIASIDELARPGIFESDAELDEFLESVRTERNAELA